MAHTPSSNDSAPVFRLIEGMPAVALMPSNRAPSPRYVPPIVPPPSYMSSSALLFPMNHDATDFIPLRYVAMRVALSARSDTSYARVSSRRPATIDEL